MKHKNVGSIVEMAQVLKERRKQIGVTQITLANYCNLSHNGISQIELGKKDIKLSTILKLSKILGFRLIIETD